MKMLVVMLVAPAALAACACGVTGPTEVPCARGGRTVVVHKADAHVAYARVEECAR